MQKIQCSEWEETVKGRNSIKAGAIFYSKEGQTDYVKKFHGKQNVTLFERGHIVWGKIKSYPRWPAMVLNAEECGRSSSNNKKLWLFWFGDHKFSEVGIEEITDFQKSFLRNFTASKGKCFNKAIEEILQLLAEMNDIKFNDSSDLFKWASSGFKQSVPVCFIWKRKVLPNMIQSEIECWLKPTRNESDSDMDCHILIEVLRGSKKLEDICIACCKDRKLVEHHPLFIGRLCLICKKNVIKVCNMALGQMHSYCMICGQGGNLVFCSNSLCLRSYCQLCIEDLVSGKAYRKILKDDEWLCYLCKADSSKRCLIRRRVAHKPKRYIPPQIPQKWFSVKVLALNETTLKILESVGFNVEKYEINPTIDTVKFRDYATTYIDFTYHEILEISPDLVTGVFFTPYTDFKRENSTIMFFTSFYRFLYRLDTAKLCKENVFFAFFAEVNFLDENVLSRVIRFLMVDPVPITFGDRKFMLWNNFFKSESLKYQSKEAADNKNVERKVFLKIFKKLLLHFDVV